MTKIKQDKRNYRRHNDVNKKVIRKSLEELGAGRSIVIDNEGEIIAGNGVYEQAKAIGLKVREIETDGSELVVVKRTDLATDDEKRKKLALADNAASDMSEWDEELLREDWDADVLADWGVELPTEIEGLPKEKPEKNEEAEALLIKAMKQYCGEFRQQLDDALSHGWLFQGITRGYARLKFLRAKYYGERYERKNAVVFAPEIFLTSSHKKGVSYYEQLKISATNKNDAGIAGFRTLTNDGLLLLLLGGNGYPICGGRSCADFPVEVARRLYARYAGAGRVLDPCAGWGGRQIGALLENVAEYVGIDPSPIAIRAAKDIYATFGEYQQTKCRFVQKPYEKTTDEEIGTDFDFALTSPPYFDVEDYQGGEQSHKEYNNFELWVQKFYEPLIVMTMRRLKNDGAFALQVGSQTYPLKRTAEEICKRNGFKIETIETKTLNADVLHGTSEEAGEVTLLITK